MVNMDPLPSDGCRSSSKSKLFSLTTVSCKQGVCIVCGVMHATNVILGSKQVSVHVCGQQEINYDFVLHV